MSNTIQIKRRTSGSGTLASLLEGELGVDLTDSNKLYVGTSGGNQLLNPSASTNYLPLSGGTLTGRLTLDTTQDGLRLNSAAAILGQTSGTTSTQLLYWNGSNQNVYLGRSTTSPNNGSVSNWYFRVGGSDKLSITSAGATVSGSLTATSGDFSSHINIANDFAVAWGGGSSRPYISGNKTNGTLIFGEGGSEHFRMDTDGALLIDTTSKGSSSGRLYVGSPYVSSAAIAQFNGFLRFGYAFTHDSTRGLSPHVSGQGSIGTDSNRYGKGFFQRLDIGVANDGEGTSFGDLVVKQQGDTNADGFAIVGTTGNPSLRLWTDVNGNRKINAGGTEVISFTTSAISLLQTVTASGTGHLFGKLNVGSVNNSFDFYNNGTSYFNGAVTVDDNLTVSSSVSVGGALDCIKSGTNILTIQGSSSGYVNAGISLRATSDTHYRGLGVFMHDAGGDTEWFAGRPYADSDKYIIARKASQASHSTATAQTSNSLFTIASTGAVSIGATLTVGDTLLTTGGSDANLRLRSSSNRSGLFIDKPGTTTIMGSALVLASDESYRLGTASYYHVVCQQGGGTLL